MAILSTDSKNTTIKNITACYSQKVSASLVEIKTSSEKYSFKLDGFISNADYSNKSFEFILFINSILFLKIERCVENKSLKKSIEIIYRPYITKGNFPFIYLNLFIQPENIEVNVSGTISLIL
jgi:DNA mismatch repair protein MLH1